MRAVLGARLSCSHYAFRVFPYSNTSSSGGLNISTPLCVCNHSFIIQPLNTLFFLFYEPLWLNIYYFIAEKYSVYCNNNVININKLFLNLLKILSLFSFSLI